MHSLLTKFCTCNHQLSGPNKKYTMDNKSENKLRTHPVLIPWSLKWAWLKRNIDRNLQNLEDIALYFWLGTCNLTSKDKSRFISLSTQNNETLDHIIRTLLEFKSFLADYTQVKLTFLEVPIYSMAVAQWRQMRQMPHFWNGKCNLLKANKIFFFLQNLSKFTPFASLYSDPDYGRVLVKKLERTL